MRAAWIAAILFVSPATLISASGSSQDVKTIIQRSVEANTVDWKAAPEYEHLELDRRPDGSSKTFQVLMIEGSPYERLVAITKNRSPPNKTRKNRRSSTKRFSTGATNRRQHAQGEFRNTRKTASATTL